MLARTDLKFWIIFSAFVVALLVACSSSSSGGGGDEDKDASEGVADSMTKG
jgi:hypothetical protein